MEIRKVQQSGHCMYVALPQVFLKALKLVRRDYVVLVLHKGSIVISPLKGAKK